MIIDLYKPIRNFAYFFIIVGFLGLAVLLKELSGVNHIVEVWIFVGTISVFHLLLGAGILRKNRTFFGVFKHYLRLMYLAFPIGTYISKSTLEYIEKYNIEQYLK